MTYEGLTALHLWQSFLLSLAQESDLLKLMSLVEFLSLSYEKSLWQQVLSNSESDLVEPKSLVEFLSLVAVGQEPNTTECTFSLAFPNWNWSLELK